MDVVGLYPHISHSEDLEVLRLAMNKAEGDMPVDDLVSLAKLVLENNFFEFDENETAIGIKFAPGFANILWGILRNDFWILVSLKLGFGGVFWMMFS